MDKLYRNIIISENVYINNFVFLAQAYLYVARAYANSGDYSQLEIADYYINRCLNLLKEKETERRVILIAVDTYHFLGSLYHMWNKHEQSLIAFEKALQLYLTYNDAKEYVAPINVLPFNSDKSPDTEYLLEEQCIIILVDLLAEIRSVKTDDEDKTKHMIVDKVAVYKHKLLKRILNKVLLDEDYIKWTSQLVSLAEIFVKFESFTIAKDYLTAASFMMNKYYEQKYIEEIFIQTDEETHSTKEILVLDIYKKMVSNIDRHWAEYGLKLLQSSQEKLLRNVKDRTCKVHCQFQSTVNSEQPIESLGFVDTIPNLKKFTVNITDKYLSCYTDAKAVFITVLVYFKKALEYFIPELHLLEYVNIMQDISYAYKYLASYEQDETNQLKLHKRRLEVLTNIVNILDTENDIDILKPIWIEIAITNSNILDKITGKSRYQCDSDKLSTELLDKSKKSIDQTLCHWQLYMDCFS